MSWIKKTNCPLVFFANIIVLSILQGCASRTAIVNYSPSSKKSLNGSAIVSEFKYLPFEEKLIQKNEIETQLQKFQIDPDVSTLITEAVQLELKFSGVDINKSQNNLTGEIIRFNYSDGVHLKWNARLEIKYTLTKSNSLCFSKTILTNTSPQLFDSESVRQLVRENINNLISDSQFVRCL